MKTNILLLLALLLANLSNVRHTINAQGRTETFYNVITSYALFHVIWRLNKEGEERRIDKMKLFIR